MGSQTFFFGTLMGSQTKENKLLGALNEGFHNYLTNLCFFLSKTNLCSFTYRKYEKKQKKL